MIESKIPFCLIKGPIPAELLNSALNNDCTMFLLWQVSKVNKNEILYTKGPILRKEQCNKFFKSLAQSKIPFCLLKGPITTELLNSILNNDCVMFLFGEVSKVNKNEKGCTKGPLPRCLALKTI